MHGNLERHATYAWDPTADIVRARYLPAQFIQDRKSADADAAQVRYAQYPYAIEPVEEAAAWVADEMAAALSAVPVGSSA